MQSASFFTYSDQHLKTHTERLCATATIRLTNLGKVSKIYIHHYSSVSLTPLRFNPPPLVFPRSATRGGLNHMVGYLTCRAAEFFEDLVSEMMKSLTKIVI